MSEPDNKGDENSRVVPLIRKKGNCPICGAARQAKYRPFCSARCADIDLGRWVKESYRVPGEKVPDRDSSRPVDDD